MHEKWLGSSQTVQIVIDNRQIFKKKTHSKVVRKSVLQFIQQKKCKEMTAQPVY